MAITTDTVTLPGYTILTDSITGGIAVIPTIPEDSTSAQYYIVNEISDKLDQISEKLSVVATALSSISNSSAIISNSLNNGSTPIGTILSEIAQTSESTSNSLAGIYDRATGVGIHMKGPLDWLGLVSTYKLYVENVGPENVTLQGLIEYKAKIDALPKEFN
jgi:hypothetical protein